MKQGNPLEIWDGAHNPSGMQRLVAELPPLLGGRTAVAVFGAQRGKDVGTMIALLHSVCPIVVATASSHPSSLPADELAGLTGGIAEADPHAALRRAHELAGDAGVSRRMWISVPPA